MDLSQASAQLEAAADPSRLRLLIVLLAGEAAVAELTAVLHQSQPRVSRHLRLLTEAGLIENFREGRWVYYRLANEALAGGIADYLAALARSGDVAIAADQARMVAVRQQREREVLASARRAQGPGGHPAEAALAEALNAVLGSGPLGDVLDVGTGAGTILRLLGPRAGLVIGVDSARPMRELARARLHQAGLARCSIREADAHDLPFPAGTFDVVVIDEILRGSPQPVALLAEAGRALRSGGTLVIVEHVLPGAPRHEGAEGTFHESQLTMLLAAAGLRLTQRQWLPGRTPDRAVFAAVIDQAAGSRVIKKTKQSTPWRTGTHD